MSNSRVIATAAMLAFISGCDGAMSAGEEACEAYKETFVDKLADDCAVGTRAEVTEVVDQALAGAGASTCRAVIAVADEVTFWDECIPELEAIACETILAGTGPASCEGQLLVA